MSKYSLILILSFICFATAISQAQSQPKVAVYATGGNSQSENRALSNKITHALVSSGKYRTIERSDSFLAQIAAEQTKQQSGSIDDNQISRIGKQSGADYVCIAEIVEAFGGHQVSARIVNVETVEVIASGDAAGVLNSMQALDDLSNEVIYSMLGYVRPYIEVTEESEPAASEPVAAAAPVESVPATGKIAAAPKEILVAANVESAPAVEEEQPPPEDPKTPWQSYTSMDVGLFINMNTIDTVYKSIGYTFRFGFEFCLGTLHFIRMGGDLLVGLFDIDKEAVRRIEPRADSIDTEALLKAGAFLKLYPVDFFYLRGGISYYLSSYKYQINSNKYEMRIKEVDYPVGGGFEFAYDGNIKSFYIETLYNIMPNRSANYFSINAGLKY